MRARVSWMSFGALVAFVPGLWIGRVWTETSSRVERSGVIEPSPVSSSDRTVTRFQPAPTPTPAAEIEPEEPDATCAKAIAESTWLRGQLYQMGGLAIEWPTDVDGAFTRDSVDAVVAAAVAETDGLRRGEVDCSENPCLAVIEYAPHHPSSSTVVEPVMDALRSSGPGVATPHLSCTQRGCTAVVAWSPDDPSGESAMRARVGVRVESLLSR